MVRVHMSCSCLHDSVGGVLARIQAVPYLCKLFPKYYINVGHITCSMKLHFRVKIVVIKSHFRWIFRTGSGLRTYFNAWFFF